MSEAIRNVLVCLLVTLVVLTVGYGYIARTSPLTSRPALVSQQGGVTVYEDGSRTFTPGTPAARRIQIEGTLKVGESITKAGPHNMTTTITRNPDP